MEFHSQVSFSSQVTEWPGSCFAFQRVYAYKMSEIKIEEYLKFIIVRFNGIRLIGW